MQKTSSVCFLFFLITLFKCRYYITSKDKQNVVSIWKRMSVAQLNLPSRQSLGETEENHEGTEQGCLIAIRNGYFLNTRFERYHYIELLDLELHVHPIIMHFLWLPVRYELWSSLCRSPCFPTGNVGVAVRLSTFLREYTVWTSRELAAILIVFFFLRFPQSLQATPSKWPRIRV